MNKSASSTRARYFLKPTLSQVARRFGLIAVFAYFIGFCIMGVLTLDSDTQKVATISIPISPAPFSIQGSVLEAAKSLHLLVWHYLTHVPESCWEGDKVINSYQQMQCVQFWNRLVSLGGIAAIPFAIAFGFFFVSINGVRRKFLLARKRIASGKSLGLGVVLDPSEAPSDRLSWWYGVQPIYVQGSDGKKLIAYLPPESPVPPPGEKVTLYSFGKKNGNIRYFAILYAPHVAVVHGG